MTVATDVSEIQASKVALISGFINVNKPAGMTSHDVVARLRRWTGIKRIGHAGTLDPDATGVLPLALGKACKAISMLTSDKVYLAEILLGVGTTTDDISGTLIEQCDIPGDVDQSKIETALQEFIGEIEQKPPVYSAIHHKGKRLYELAREKNSRIVSSDQDLDLKNELSTILEEVKSRLVKIENIDLLSFSLPVLQVRITCTAGTYIRSIARDLGYALGIAGCLKSLCREKSGPFGITEAHDLNSLQTIIEKGRLSEILLSPNTVIPALFSN